MTEAIISIVWGILSALFFAFITSRKFNVFTRVCVDVVYSFCTLFALYVVMFLITRGNVLSFVYTLFAISFAITCCFIYPRAKKNKNKR